MAARPDGDHLGAMLRIGAEQQLTVANIADHRTHTISNRGIFKEIAARAWI